MTGQDLRDHIRRDFNLNTVVALVGFLSLFATIISVWTGIQFRQTKTEEWMKGHTEFHAQLKADSAALRAVYDTRIGVIEKTITELDNMNYRITANEKDAEAMDQRISRISESYTTQLGDVRTQLASISTQLALANQALLRVEKSDLNRTPGELRSPQ